MIAARSPEMVTALLMAFIRVHNFLLVKKNTKPINPNNIENGEA